MKEKFYPSVHGSIAYSLNNIGNVLNRQGKYDEALDYYQQALKIREKSYPSGHADIGVSLNNIGGCYENQNQRKMALEYYHRALNIYDKFLSVDHPDRQRTEKNIRRLTIINK
ncbi:unnamed protein product, partial [Rotaria sp. Silwood2]